MAADEARRDILRERVVAFGDRVRELYLGLPGAKRAERFAMVASRMRSAAAPPTCTAAEWCTRVLHGLQVPALDAEAAAALRALVDAVGADGADLFDLVERESGYIEALMIGLDEGRRARPQEAETC